MLGMKPGHRRTRVKAIVPRWGSRNRGVRDIKLATGLKTKHIPSMRKWNTYQKKCNFFYR